MNWKLTGAALLATLALTGCGDNKGEVSLGWFTTKDVVIRDFQDPKVPGVTCHVASIEADLSLADPSNSSIACRQTDEIFLANITDIDKSDNGELVFKQSKSVLFKSLKVRRIYDSENQTLLYLSYSTKETEGSYKHSLSTVSLWGTAAYQKERSVKN
ncbi:CreA family protein [uncultured Ferrimonas sp.]|uniref:CreA family protein n=1 Tax=uncultured Ferrimonas sp. TaxID=432640 RepID=UPI00262EBD08|nr:CreA family protein [uncultured Ferrimonas sp.]